MTALQNTMYGSAITFLTTLHWEYLSVPSLQYSNIVNYVLV